VIHPAVTELKRSLADRSDVYVPPGVDEERYFAELAADIEEHLCEPFEATATVIPPGFPGIEVGSVLSGVCVARGRGYWLVYAPERECFFCFWGTDTNSLGAHGVSGSALYCWSA
jgi:hypothetical protein